ncbi:MAG: hypothetical protein DIU78_007040 [Pseudomonadota bacterium]|nr:MAG: hypothetical protein DIU78_05425 [Pseudomonadota bacterium]
MTQSELPREVQELIAQHITSVEQLEVLLLLREHADREWSASAVSEEIRTSERSAAARLADLRTRGFLTSREDAGVTLYRFDPLTDTLRRAVASLSQVYRERRYTIIDLIFSKPIDRLRVYADAFRIRKDDSDG